MKDDKVRQSVDCDLSIPEVIQNSSRPRAEGRPRAGAGISRRVVSRPNAGTDEFEMGHKGQARVERGAKIMEEGHFQNRMIRRGREGGPENPGEVGTAPLLNRGFTEGNNLGFSE